MDLIQIKNIENKWIQLIKGNHSKYKFNNNWLNTIKPFYLEMYAVREEDYVDSFSSIFEILLDLHLKIKLDNSGCNSQLKQIFREILKHPYSGLALQAGISKLCELIQNTPILENSQPRFKYV